MYKQSGLPRWRGFNLLGLYTAKDVGDFPMEDFDLISELGFDFVRIPMNYRTWTVPGHLEPEMADKVYEVKEAPLEQLDKCVEHAVAHGLHVNLNLHRAPGYCINPGDREPFDLWKDQAAVDAFAWHWEMLAKRYNCYNSKQVSFDLVNEPPGTKLITREQHKRAIAAATNAIRKITPDRLIIADGMDAGNQTCPELKDLNIAQSCRAYVPMTLTHWKARWWAENRGWDKQVPHWPDIANFDGVWDYDRLLKHYEEWAKMSQEMGIGVHCGEGGCYIHTPHDVAIRWMNDVMDILQHYNIGYALWNFRGDFGILDSNRKDCKYEEWRGHLLDREMLEILKRH